MKYKRFTFLKIFCFLAFFLGALVVRSYALDRSNSSISNVKSVQSPNEKFSRARTLGNDILCEETFEYSPETEFLNSNNCKLYKKTLKVIKKFKIIKHRKFKSVAQWEYQFVFTYDKKGFVEAENSDKDIDIKTVKSKWSIMDVKEVFSDDKMCLVSVKSLLYEDNILDTPECIVDGHVDVFCTIMGDIGINTDLH